MGQNKYFCKNTFSIFLFHGVIKKNNFGVRNYNKKHILENDFYNFLKEIKKNSEIIPIENIIEGFNFNENKKKCIITFDDGFENNYNVAAPILDDLNIPATFYFSTDFIENNTMSWIDKIEYCIENTSEKEIKVPWLQKKISIKNKDKKIKFLEFLRKKIKKDLKFNYDNFVSYIFDATKIKKIQSLNSEIDKKISWAQVNKLKSNKLFTIGGHSHEHLSFGTLSNNELKKQVDTSFGLFSKRISHRLKHYSYPEGQKIDYNKRIINYLKSKKIICCPSAINGFNNKKTSLFDLKRIPITHVKKN